MLSWVVFASVHEYVTEDTHDSRTSPKLCIILFRLCDLGHEVFFTLFFLSFCVFFIKLNYDLPQLFVVYFDVEMDLLLEIVRMLLVVVVF